ncbi:hypothetical protein B0H13DRAFT_2366095 [Mycena leptocephala]|nr:hypothetical protein B0H13DRAFT_2366095 [Mycena leptocephala]
MTHATSAPLRLRRPAPALALVLRPSTTAGIVIALLACVVWAPSLALPRARLYPHRVPRKERRNLPWAGQDELKVVLPCPSMRGENPSWTVLRVPKFACEVTQIFDAAPMHIPLFPFSKYYVPNVIPACTSLLYLRAIRDVYEEVPIQSWADDICLVTYTISV